MKIPFSGTMRRCCQSAGLLLALSASTASIAEEQDLPSIAQANFQAADAASNIGSIAWSEIIATHGDR